MKNNQILFLTALKSEAIPIIKKINSIQKYIKESNNIKNMICINIGTAGGNSSVSKIGELFYINKITDDITKKSFFPDVLFHHRMKESELVTVKEPILNKNKKYKTLIDMEAYWIFDILSSFIPSHRLIFIKIISDHMNFYKINKAKFEQLSKILIEENLKKVVDALEPVFESLKGVNIIRTCVLLFQIKIYLHDLQSAAQYMKFLDNYDPDKKLKEGTEEYKELKVSSAKLKATFDDREILTKEAMTHFHLNDE